MVRVHLDPPWTVLERGLSSVGRAPALQAGCHRFESVRLHQNFRHDQQARCSVCSSCWTRVHGTHFTSFREIIGVIGRNRVGLRWSSRPTMTLSKSSTLTKVLPLEERSPFPRGKGGKRTCIDRKQAVRRTKGPGCRMTRSSDRGLSSSGSNQAR